MSAFKGWQSTRKNKLFAGFPNIITIPDNFLYGFPRANFFLDASLGTSTKTNNANVSFWVNQISRAVFAQSNTGLQPIFLSADANFNNLPSIAFHTNSRYLSSNSGLALSKSNFTMFVVIRMISNGATQNIIFNNGSRLDTNQFAIRPTAASGYGIYTNTSPVLVSSTYDTAPYIIVVTDSEIFINGTSVVSGNWNPSTTYNFIGDPNTGFPCLCAIQKWGNFNVKMSSADIISLTDRINSEVNVF
jgi:hypothetical protein